MHETWEQCALRELEEETGITLKVGDNLLSSPDLCWRALRSPAVLPAHLALASSNSSHQILHHFEHPPSRSFVPSHVRRCPSSSHPFPLLPHFLPPSSPPPLPASLFLSSFSLPLLPSSPHLIPASPPSCPELLSKIPLYISSTLTFPPLLAPRDLTSHPSDSLALGPPSPSRLASCRQEARFAAATNDDMTDVNAGKHYVTIIMMCCCSAEQVSPRHPAAKRRRARVRACTQRSL